MADGLGWWQRRWVVALVALAMAIPLLWPVLPPLTDLNGHIGRYAIQLGIDSSPYYHQWYRFRWAVIGNLGVDLLVEALAPLFGLEPTVKGIAIAIPVLTATGMLWLAREAHGRVPATAWFALPLAYGYPFQFGFVNFALAMALALNGAALWLRLGRKGRLRLRAVLFVPLGLIAWVAHIFGWAVLAVIAGAAEVERWRDAGHSRALAFVRGALSSLPLAPPILMMLLWRSGDVKGRTVDWFNWEAKFTWFLSILRDRWTLYDKICVWLLAGLVLAAFIGWVRSRSGRPRTIGFEHRLGLAALLLALCYLLLPRILIGSAYADMRLAPFALAIALLAIRVDGLSARSQGALAGIALGFVAMRLAGTTYNYVQLDRGYRDQLAALDHIPTGSRILALIDLPCSGAWGYSRMDHLAAIAIARRQAFVNGQWDMPGAQLLTVDYPAGGRFVGDPTQLLRPPRCHRHGEPRLDDTLANFPRPAFDFLWMVDRPLAGAIRGYPELVPVWHGRRSGILYRVAAGSATSASDTPNGSDRRATQ